MYPLFVQVKKSLIDIKTLFFKRDQEGEKRAAEIINTTIGFNKLLGQATCGIFFLLLLRTFIFKGLKVGQLQELRRRAIVTQLKWKIFIFLYIIFIFS